MNFGCVRFLIGFQWPLGKGTKVRISEHRQDNREIVGLRHHLLML